MPERRRRTRGIPKPGLTTPVKIEPRKELTLLIKTKQLANEIAQLYGYKSKPPRMQTKKRKNSAWDIAWCLYVSVFTCVRKDQLYGSLSLFFFLLLFCDLFY
jgi:hypothetical protein